MDAAAEAAAESFEKLMQLRFEAPKPRGRSMSPMQSRDAELPSSVQARAPTTPPAPWRMTRDSVAECDAMRQKLQTALREVEVIRQNAKDIKQQLRPYNGSDDPPPVDNPHEPVITRPKAPLWSMKKLRGT